MQWKTIRLGRWGLVGLWKQCTCMYVLKWNCFVHKPNMATCKLTHPFSAPVGFTFPTFSSLSASSYLSNILSSPLPLSKPLFLNKTNQIMQNQIMQNLHGSFIRYLTRTVQSYWLTIGESQRMNDVNNLKQLLDAPKSLAYHVLL